MNQPPRDNSLFVAVSVFSLSDQTSILNSNVCGKCMELWSDTGSVVVTVVDVMMREDANSQDLDLSTAAFSAVVPGGIDAGIGYANWNWVDCNTGGSGPNPGPEEPSWGVANWETCQSGDWCADSS
ncbi:hypothetical protein HDU98_004324, partial [Podochytrium sp. JEL0797]